MNTPSEYLPWWLVNGVWHLQSDLTGAYLEMVRPYCGMAQSFFADEATDNEGRPKSDVGTICPRCQAMQEIKDRDALECAL